MCACGANAHPMPRPQDGLDYIEVASGILLASDSPEDALFAISECPVWIIVNGQFQGTLKKCPASGAAYRCRSKTPGKAGAWMFGLPTLGGAACASGTSLCSCGA